MSLSSSLYLSLSWLSVLSLFLYLSMWFLSICLISLVCLSDLFLISDLSLLSVCLISLTCLSVWSISLVFLPACLFFTLKWKHSFFHQKNEKMKMCSYKNKICEKFFFSRDEKLVCLSDLSCLSVCLISLISLIYLSLVCLSDPSLLSVCQISLSLVCLFDLSLYLSASITVCFLH